MYSFNNIKETRKEAVIFNIDDDDLIKSFLNADFFKNHLSHRHEHDVQETKAGDMVRRYYKGKNTFYQVLKEHNNLLLVKELKPIIALSYSDGGESFSYFKYLKNVYVENTKEEKALISDFIACYKVDLYIFNLKRDYKREDVYLTNQEF